MNLNKLIFIIYITLNKGKTNKGTTCKGIIMFSSRSLLDVFNCGLFFMNLTYVRVHVPSSTEVTAIRVLIDLIRNNTYDLDFNKAYNICK